MALNVLGNIKRLGGMTYYFATMDFLVTEKLMAIPVVMIILGDPFVQIIYQLCVMLENVRPQTNIRMVIIAVKNQKNFAKHYTE